MTLHCVSLRVSLCAFTAYISHTYLHMCQVCWASKCFTPMSSCHMSSAASFSISSVSEELSQWCSQLCFTHFSCCPVSVAWMLPGLLSQSPIDERLGCFQTKPPIHSYLLPCASEQVQVLRMGFVNQGEEEYQYSICGPPSPGSPGLNMQGQGRHVLQAPVSETVQGSR